MISFVYESSQSNARLGRIDTCHGVVETPAFIFCATKGAIKGLTMKEMREVGTQIILSNTYHLMLQPGPDPLFEHGGLPSFTGWNGPMLTDSGGFQIFSLGHGSVASEIKGSRDMARPKTLLKINEEGACFKSYIDGKPYLLSPERSIRLQRAFGADLIVVFDECTPFHVEKEYTKSSMKRSHRWAQRSLQEFLQTPHMNALNAQNGNESQALYGIIQGGVYTDLRSQSCDFVNGEPFFGHAIGGSLGASKAQMEDVVAFTLNGLSKDRPRHLLGIGGLSDIWFGVAQGIDTFDCVHPTRLGRHGGALVRPPHHPERKSRKNEQKDLAFSKSEHINLRNSMYKKDHTPIEPDCPCPACLSISKSYIHHLLKAKELSAYTLITLHNVCFMNRMMQAIRSSLKDGTYETEMRKWID